MCGVIVVFWKNYAELFRSSHQGIVLLNNYFPFLTSTCRSYFLVNLNHTHARTNVGSTSHGLCICIEMTLSVYSDATTNFQSTFLVFLWCRRKSEKVLEKTILYPAFCIAPFKHCFLLMLIRKSLI